MDPEEFCILQHTASIVGELLVFTKGELDKFQQSLESIFSMLLNLLKLDKVHIDTSFSDIVLGMLKVHMATIQSRIPSLEMTPVHVDFIGNYFLAKRYARTLDDNLTYLLNNYMVYGFLHFPEDLKDRFIIEVLMLIAHNIRQKQSQKLGLQACFALTLGQSMLVNLHEDLSRSQVQDVVVTAMQIMQSDARSQTVLTACFTTLDAALVYCPMITIQTLLQRQFLFNLVSTLNKKLITICQTFYDRRLLVLSLVSLMRHTMDSELSARLNHGELLKFIIYLLEYHQLISNLHEDLDNMGPQEITRYGNLQKNIMCLQLLKPSDNPEDDKNDGLELDENMKEEETNAGKKQYQFDDDDNDYDDSGKDSLFASDDSEDFKNHDFDVPKFDLGKILQATFEEVRYSIKPG